MTYSVTTFITNYKDDAKPHTESNISFDRAVRIADSAADHPCFVWSKVSNELNEVVYSADASPIEEEAFHYAY